MKRGKNCIKKRSLDNNNNFKLNSTVTDSSLEKYLIKKVNDNLNKNLEQLKIEPNVLPAIKNAAHKISNLTIAQFKTEQSRIRQLNNEKSKYKQSVLNKHLEKFKLNDCIQFIEKLKDILVENEGFISVDISVEPCFEEVEIKGKAVKDQNDVKYDDDDIHYYFWMEFAGFSSESRADTLSEAKLKGYERLVRKITKKSTIELVKLFFDVEEKEKCDFMQIKKEVEDNQSEAVVEVIDF